MSHITELLDSREPLQRAWGDNLSTPTPEMRRVADAALQGVVYFFTDKPTPVGRSDSASLFSVAQSAIPV